MTYKEAILNFLSDGEWHTVSQLIGVYYKYTQRIYDLRKDGYLIETKQNPYKVHEDLYRLVLNNKVQEEVYAVLESEIEKKVKQEKLFEIPYRY